MKEPLHVVFKQYRVYSVAIVVFMMVITERLMTFIEVNHTTMTDSVAIAVIGLAGAITGSLIKALDTFVKAADKDQE